jgi:hypothetical protein
LAAIAGEMQFQGAITDDTVERICRLMGGKYRPAA